MLTALKDHGGKHESKGQGRRCDLQQGGKRNFTCSLATGYGTIEAAIKKDISSGTNTHAGLLAGKQLLDEDKEVAANRKYLIFVSDGITYMYNAKPTVTAWSFNADGWKCPG